MKARLLLSLVALFLAGKQPAMAQTVLLNGASTPAAQGWTASGTSTPAATVTNNGSFTEISTLGTTGGSGSTSGTLLYSKSFSLSSLPTFQINISLQVVAGSGVHNLLDAPVAFGTSIDNPFGTTTQRKQMLYFDPTGIGWGDQSDAFAMDTTDAFHSYSLFVNTLTGVASLAVDGVPRLTRTGYVTNDKLTFGDQTNDPDVNGDFRIASIDVVPEPASLTLIGLAGIVVLRRRCRARRN
jgi:hypothetical protein